jgi:hypothetical protein
MNTTNQGACQSRRTAKNWTGEHLLAKFPNQELVANPNVRSGTFTMSGASSPNGTEEFGRMIGKLFGAWAGEKAAGRNEGAKGAILGYGAAALAKRSVPTLAALVLGGWALKKWRERRRAHPHYPSDASPSSSAASSK